VELEDEMWLGKDGRAEEVRKRPYGFLAGRGLSLSPKEGTAGTEMTFTSLFERGMSAERVRERAAAVDDAVDGPVVVV
jgi:hypothetical protein